MRIFLPEQLENVHKITSNLPVQYDQFKLHMT